MSEEGDKLGLKLGPGEGLQIGVQAHQDKDGGGEHYPVHEPEAAGRNAHIFKGSSTVFSKVFSNIFSEVLSTVFPTVFSRYSKSLVAETLITIVM